MLRLRELRKEKNLKQSDVARAVDGSQRTVSNWENGTSEPDIAMLIRLADYFEVSLDYLTGRSDEFGHIEFQSDVLDDREQELLSLYRNLSEHDRTVLDEIARTYRLKYRAY